MQTYRSISLRLIKVIKSIFGKLSEGWEFGQNLKMSNRALLDQSVSSISCAVSFKTNICDVYLEIFVCQRRMEVVRRKFGTVALTIRNCEIKDHQDKTGRCYTGHLSTAYCLRRR